MLSFFFLLLFGENLTFPSTCDKMTYINLKVKKVSF